uniref:Uncharacterized protein n=1 Tax=Leersia perrieri TaxID=77586 RepID=A0A0D9W026_9ORYZ
MRIADPPVVSALAITCSGDGGHRLLPYSAGVEVADRNLLILTANFHGLSEFYYLIYNSTDASLTITPHLPIMYNPSFTLKPLPIRH